MPVVKETAIGTCNDCKTEIQGNLTVEFYDCKSATPWVATGSLPDQCREHHDKNRIWGQKETPQHSDFVVTESKKRIGTMRVATMTLENPFFVEDKDAIKQLGEDGRRWAKERGIW